MSSPNRSISKFILALDVSTQKEAIDLVKKFLPNIKIFKVGKELFTREGPGVVKEIQQCGGKVFLDLKFHDIPNTVLGASRAACELGVFMFNVHALGGVEMMKAARLAADASSKEKGSSPLVIAVTILTSLSEKELHELGFQEKPARLAIRYADMAKQTGLDGVVCAAQDVQAIKKKCGKNFLVVTPGIRFEEYSLQKDDQKRIATPEYAIQKGADFLVLGRSFLKSIEKKDA